jgi:hypothetical protein
MVDADVVFSSEGGGFMALGFWWATCCYVPVDRAFLWDLFTYRVIEIHVEFENYFHYVSSLVD